MKQRRRGFDVEGVSGRDKGPERGKTRYLNQHFYLFFFFFIKSNPEHENLTFSCLFNRLIDLIDFNFNFENKIKSKLN